MFAWARIEVRGGRGPQAEERLSAYCRLRANGSPVWGRRTRHGFWLSARPSGQRILRPVLRGRLVETGNAVVIRGRMRPVLWSGSVILFGPMLMALAVVTGAAGLFVAGGLAALPVVALAWSERRDYMREAHTLRAVAARVVGASP